MANFGGSKSRLVNLWVLALLWGLALPGTAQMPLWSQFRGPNHNGSVPAPWGEHLPAGKTIQFEKLWRIPLGTGYAGLVLDQDKLYTQLGRQGRTMVAAYHRQTGQEAWAYDLGDYFPGFSGSHDGPIATPQQWQGQLFVAHPAGPIAALKTEDGSLQWQLDPVAELGARQPKYGFIASPLIWNKQLLLGTAHSENGNLTSVDPISGKVLWQAGTGAMHSQNATPLTLQGRQQWVAAFNKSVHGFDPKTGETLWSLELPESNYDWQVIPIDQQRFLLAGYYTAMMYKVALQEGQFQVQEDWRSEALKKAYALPIYQNGYLYGMNSRFTTCVDGKDGSTVWKSRKPGGRTISAAGDTLFTLTKEGHLVAFAAESAGYRELGRMALFEPGAHYSQVIFDGNTLYARTMSQLAAVRFSLGESHQRPSEHTPAVTGVLAEWVARIKQAENPQAQVAAFFEAFPVMPIAEPGFLHLAFEGDLADLAVRGDFTEHWNEWPLARVDGTDLFVRSIPIPHPDRFEYRFRVFDENRLDPRNPLQVETENGPRSVVIMPAAPKSFPIPNGSWSPRQREEIITLHPPHDPQAKPMKLVCYPSPNGDKAQALGLLIVAAGTYQLKYGQAKAWIDNTPTKTPFIAVFLDISSGYYWGGGRMPFEQALREAILPTLMQRFPISGDLQQRVLLGHSNNGANLAYAVLKNPGLLGGIAWQSPEIPLHFETDIKPLLRGDHPQKIYLDWGRYSGKSSAYKLDIAGDAQQLAAILKTQGEVLARETPGGHSWYRLQQQWPVLLPYFFGKPKAR